MKNAIKTSKLDNNKMFICEVLGNKEIYRKYNLNGEEYDRRR